MADQLWRRFRSWPLWAQIGGWLFGFWLLVPLLIWRTSWNRGAKTAATAAFLVFVAAVGRAEEPEPPAPAPAAEQSEEAEPAADSPEPAPEEPPPAEPVEAKQKPPAAPGIASRVTRVIDGDTVEATYGGQEVSVRLIGIDTPETVHPSEPVGCLGREASAFTKRELDGARIRLEFDVERTDRYGRMLA